MADTGKQAADLKWNQGLSWTEVYERFPGEAPTTIRSAARRYKASHSDEFPGTAEAPGADEYLELGHTFEEEGNRGEATSVSTQVTSLDEQIAACSIDTEAWECRQYRVKTYDGWRADTEKDLVWEGGRIVEGHVRSGGILTQTLYSINSLWVRKAPVALRPTFQPVRATGKYPLPGGPVSDQVTKALLFSDAQIGFEKSVESSKLIPFHDRRVLDLVVQVAAVYQPHYIGVLGDLFDLTMWSQRFAREPEFYWTTQPAVLEGHWWLRRLREACPNARIVYLEGNHELRMPAYVRDNVLDAYGLRRAGAAFPAVSLPHLLDLPVLRVEWCDGYPQERFSPTSWMNWRHGDTARVAGATGRAMLESSLRWQFYGHTHRREVVSKSLEDGGPDISSVSFGCTCHTDGRVPGSSDSHQWQQGFGVVEFHDPDPAPAVEMLSVRDGAVTWRGRRFEAREVVSYLKDEFDSWNW